MNTERPIELSDSAAAALLGVPASELVVARTTAGGNTTWRVDATDQTWFVKAHTRPWYDWDPLPAAAIAVRHEASAYRLLAEAGLAVPNLVVAYDSADNPVGWPCLVLSEVSGESLPVAALGPKGADALAAAGEYLAAAHAIAFEHAGYLLDGPPPAPPHPDRYQHSYWTPERFLTSAFSTWADDRAELGDGLLDEIAALLVVVAPRLESEFRPPRFITGDCHASQIFIDTTSIRPQVRGVIDMEVASAGAPIADLFKLTVELAGTLPASLRWWDPLFSGYSLPLDFDTFRLFALAQSHINYVCHGQNSWPGSRRDIVRHLLDARTWDELFELSRIANA